MQPVTLGAKRYDPLTQVLHWTTALLVAAQWLGAQTIDWFPRGPLRIDARSTHIAFGVLLGVLLTARVVWRLTRGRRLPAADAGVRNLLAKAVHLILYALVAAMVLVGLALAWTRGDSLFNLFRIPAYDPGNRALAEQVQGVHEIIGWAIVGVAGLHAAAALAHRYLWRDQVLARMLPSR